MRYQIELGPRIPSSNTSAGLSFLATSSYFSRQVQRGHRLVLGLGAGDLDQRHHGLPAAGALLRARGAFSAGPSRSARSSSWSRLPAASSMPSHGSPCSANRWGTVAMVKFSGGSRRPRPTAAASTPGVGRGPHRVGRSHGAVEGVLVEVDEHALAFFLPPSCGRQVRRPPLHLAGHRLCGQPDELERPPPLDARIDVEAARARRLRPRGQAVVLEHLARDRARRR